MGFYSKTPRFLYSYLATEMLGPFFASFLIMNCVFFLSKLIPFLNFVLDLNIGAADFVRLFSYLFPNIFLYSIPMAAMLGVTIGFARLSSDSEILAFKASGISMYQILPPVLIVAALIALLTGYVSIKLIPQSAVSMKQLTYQLLKEKISKGIKEHVFTEALGDVVVYVDKIDKQSGQWSRVWVSDMRQGDNPIVTMASTGSMTSSIEDMTVSLVLKNGSLHKPGNDNAQIVQFDRYQINIPLRPPESGATQLKKNALTMGELLEEARKAKDLSKDKRDTLIEFHKRIVLPVGCLMMSLIGLPLGLQARPGKKAIGIQAGLAIFILYYVFFTLAKAMAEKSVLPVWLAMWSPNFFFCGLAVFWTMRIAKEQRLIPERVTVCILKLAKLCFAPMRAILQKTWGALTIRRIKSSYGLPAGGDPHGEDAITGNVKTREFHLPGCENYHCRNCTLLFINSSIASEAGFHPCPACKTRIESVN